MDRLEQALELDLGRNSRSCLDGQAGIGSGIASGKEFSRLPAKRMEWLERALELELGRNSRGWLWGGWRGWNGLWIWFGEGILEAACEEDGQAGIGSGIGAGKEFSKLPAKMMERLEQALELDQGKDSRGWLCRASRGWDRSRTGTKPDRIASHPTSLGQGRGRNRIE